MPDQKEFMKLIHALILAEQEKDSSSEMIEFEKQRPASCEPLKQTPGEGF